MGFLIDSCIIQDLWLASQAVRYDLTLLTKNPKDFEDISELKLVLFKQGKTKMNNETYLEELVKDCLANAK